MIYCPYGFAPKNLIRISLFVLMILLLLSFPMPDKAHSRSCDPDIAPVENNKIKYMPRGNRCEGFYRAKVAGGRGIAVVGLLKGSLRFKQEKKIRIYSPLVKDRAVHVRAVGIPVKTYYRMDARLGAGKQLKWPLNEVVLPAGLPAGKIGLFGWMPEEENEGKVLVPLCAEAGPGPYRGDKKIR
ncbi:MAG: hypothetical protein GY849_15070, partial [Deltaproteobacteria bacterium]|nr:hypothetical protein [Deltaproteobacteria bacterium]